MKIVEAEKGTKMAPFMTLSNGTVFKFGDNYWMVVDNITNVNAIELSTGVGGKFFKEHVQLVDCELVIK